MPTFKVTDPRSGRTLRLTGDSPPTQQELEQLFSQFQAQEELPIDRDVMQRSPTNLRRQTLDQLAADVSTPEAFAIGAGRGLTTIGRAVGIADPESGIERQAFESLERQKPISTTAGELVGETAPFLPAGLAAGGLRTLAGRVGAGAGVGLAEGGLISRGRGGDVQEQVETGLLAGTAAGAIELALPVVGRLGGALVRRVMGRAPEGQLIDVSGRPSPELQDALSKSGLTIDDLGEEAQSILARSPEMVDPAQAARSAFIEEQGLTPTKAQVTRSADDFQAQQEAAKTSGRVREALEDQEAILTSRFNQSVLDTGGRVDLPTSTVTDSLVGKATVLDQQISDLYKEARSVAPGEKNVRFESLTSKLRQLAPANRRSGGAIETVVGDLQSKGVLDKDMNIVGKIDVETAEDVRKLTNELFDPQNTFANGLLRQLKDSIDDDVFRAAGDDVFRQGRRAKADFENELSRAKISKFDSRKANLVRDVLENKVSPDTFTNDVVFSKKWRAEDIRQLKDYISTDSAGAGAFNDLRADTLSKIRNKAFIGPEDAAGNRALSRTALQSQIDKIGPQKMGVLFNSQERKFLDDMLKISKIREPVRGTALGRGPSAQAIARLESKLSELPILGALVQFIDIDAQGRMALKANPSTLPSVASEAEKQLRGIAAQAGAGGAIALGAQE